MLKLDKFVTTIQFFKYPTKVGQILQCVTTNINKQAYNS